MEKINFALLVLVAFGGLMALSLSNDEGLRGVPKHLNSLVDTARDEIHQ